MAADLSGGSRVSRTRFGVLGPLQVLQDGKAVRVGADQERILLAVLLLRANQVVGVDDLVGWLWPDEEPRNPRATLQNYVWRLRKKVGAGLRSRPLGYEMVTDQRDLDEFRALAVRATAAAAGGDRRAEADLLRRALELWRGPILVDVPCDALHRDVVPGIEEELLAALHRRVDADLAAGRHADLVPELRTLVATYPLREGFWAQLMLALYRDGRQADALATYRQVSRLLAEELGIDPGERLRTMHEAVLAADPELGGPPVRPAAPVAAWVPMRQLPLRVADFVGHETLFEQAVGLLTTPDRVPVLALSGLPGVGKSALAIRIGHAVRKTFADGQWYVRLGGAGEPREPGSVLADLLRASGVATGQVPDGLDARAAALRARLADRRVLLVLDDAADVEQVVPLLPGEPGSAVLVTSRQEMAGLAVRYGGRYVRLDVLEPAEATELITRLLGAGRGPADRAARLELTELCGRLPLALRIACANIAHRPDATVSGYVGQLRDATHRLGTLAVPGDDRIGVRAAFDLSYVALPAADQRLFRLLGALPGRDVTAPAVAAFAGLDPAAVGAALRRLVDANLVEQHQPGRYHLHDLLRLYAAQRAEASDDRPAAMAALGEWVLATAGNASAVACHGETARADAPYALEFADRDGGWAWLEAERGNLIAIAGSHPEPWRFADALFRYFYFGGYGPELRTVAEAGLVDADRRDDPGTAARMWRYLETAHMISGDREAAIRSGERAVTISRALGDEAEESRGLIGLGDDYVEGGRLPEAVEALTRAVELSRRAGLGSVEANAINNLGNAYERLGRPDDALHSYREALRAAEALDRPDGILVALLNVGHMHWMLGQLRPAEEHLRRSLAVAARTPYRLPETHARLTLARMLTTAGRGEEALASARHGFELAEQVGAGS